MDYMGPGFKLCYDWVIKHVANERNDALQQYIHEFKTVGTFEHYVQPADPVQELEKVPWGQPFKLPPRNILRQPW